MGLWVGSGCGKSVPTAQVQAPKATVAEDPASLFLGVFPEALIPVGAVPTSAETASLKQAVESYSKTRVGNPEKLDRLEEFMAAHPGSPWVPALRLNCGLIYHENGRYSRALASLRQAWALLKNSKDPKGKALGDRAAGELAITWSYLGRYEELEPLLREVKDRSLTGPATELITAANEGLYDMKTAPERSFLCGPLALNRICLLRPNDHSPKVLKMLSQLRSTKKGTSLSQLWTSAHSVGLDYRLAYRSPGAPVVTPALVHWKVGHFSCLQAPEKPTKELYQVEDPTHGAFGDRITISKATLDEEATGYFLIPPGPLPKGWRAVSLAEGSQIWGRGDTGPNKDGRATGICDVKTECSTCPGMAQAAAHTMVVGLALQDTPLGTSPNPFSLPFTLNYAQRDMVQPTVFPYTNFGPKWTCNWLSFISTDLYQTRPSLYEMGGGVEVFNFYGPNLVAPGLTFGFNSQATLHINYATDLIGPTYEREFPDGTKMYYDLRDERTNLYNGARVFLTRIVDPQGNVTSIQYDQQYRITSLTNATGKITTLSYGLTSDPLKVTRVTDPYGRHADFTYSADGVLTSITDTLGISSQFEYGANNFIRSLKTPYGTSTFQYGDSSTDAGLGVTRWLTLTDPSGRTTRVESTPAVPGVEWVEEQAPEGMQVHNFALNTRNTFVWTPEQLQGGVDYAKATIFHFQHASDAIDGGVYGYFGGTARTLESVKRPLERRVWFNYKGAYGDLSPTWERGLTGFISAVGRVLGDGSTQLTRMDYNSKGNLSSRQDPAGRNYVYEYAGNGIDLTSLKVNGQQLMTASYDGSHNIQTLTNAAGGTSAFSYNARGQVASATNPLGQTTSYSYTADGDLTGVQEPMNKATTFTTDAIGRRTSATDSEGYTVQAEYDNFDRPTKLTYPDGTNELLEYHLLDLAATTDRNGRRASYQFDSSRRLTAITDPKGGVTTLGYGAFDKPTSLSDPEGRLTVFDYDIQSRISLKQYSGGGSEQYSYLPCCGLPRTITDALGRSKKLSYNVDSTLKTVTYSGTTPAVSYTYDSVLPRLLSMTDGTGQTAYTYGAFGSPGANQVASITGPYGDSAAFTYDVAGRPVAQTVNGSAENVTYDDLWRPTSTTNALDTFNTEYWGKTGQVTGVNSTLGPSMAYTYGTNVQDRRLTQIKNLGRAGDALSQFDYQYDAVGQITKLTETVGAGNTTGGGGGGDCHDKCCHKGKCCKKDKCCKKKCCKGKGDCGKSRCNKRHGRDDDDWGMAVPFDPRLLNGLLGVSIASLWAGLLWQFARRPRTTTSRLAQVTSAALISALALNGCIFSGGGDSTGSVNVMDFTYDRLGQLVGVDVNQVAQERYQFDPSGNLTSLTVGNTTTSFAANNLNQQTTPGTHAYDAKGQKTTLDGKTFEWDDQGRVTAIVQGTTRSEFAYDGMSRRTKITEYTNGTVTSKKLYFWLGGSIVCERDGLVSGFPITKHYFGQGVLQGTTKLFYTTDHLGSVRELVDDAGTVQAQYRYTTYGERTKESGNLESDFGWAGLWHHGPSGLDLATYRIYDSANKRWISRDPLGEGVDYNLYRYCGNSPITWVDPDGLQPVPSPSADGYEESDYGRSQQNQAIGIGARATRTGMQMYLDNLTDWKNYLGGAMAGAGLKFMGFFGKFRGTRGFAKCPKKFPRKPPGKQSITGKLDTQESLHKGKAKFDKSGLPDMIHGTGRTDTNAKHGLDQLKGKSVEDALKDLDE